MTALPSALAAVQDILRPAEAGWRAIQAEITAMTPPALPSVPGVRALASLRLRAVEECRALASALAGVQGPRVHVLHGPVVDRCLGVIVTAWPSRTLADIERYKASLGGVLWDYPGVVCEQAVDHLTRVAKRFPARPDLARVLKECAADHAELARLCRLHLDEAQHRALQPPRRDALSPEERAADKAKVRAMLLGALGEEYLRQPGRKGR